MYDHDLHIFIVEAASLVSSCETFPHSIGIIFEFLIPHFDPFLGLFIECTRIKNIFGKLNKTVKALKWMAWRDLLFRTGRQTNEDDC